MKKYSFLVYHRDYTDFLKRIQELGVLHVIEKQTGEIEDEEIKTSHQKLQELNHAIKFLSKIRPEEIENDLKKDGWEKLDTLKKLQSVNNSNETRITQIKKEIVQLNPWGDFDWSTIKKLANQGLRIIFYACPVKKFNSEWEENYYISRISEIAGIQYFVIFSKKDEPVTIEADEIRLPENSLADLNIEKNRIEGELEKIREEYVNLSKSYLHTFESLKRDLVSGLDFKKVILNTQKEADEKLMLLEGWVPKDEEKELVKHLEEIGVYYVSENPKQEDNVPIKLKNNWFAKLFEPIGQLYSLPAYNELDLTPFFAPFFMLFFGFCLGDVGYGLIILLAAFLVKKKVKPEVKPIITLGQFLGISTIIMGIISGTFFGINLIETDFLFFSKLRFMMLDSKELMTLALIIGGVQIIFGMSLKAARIIKFEGFRASLSTLGWIFVIVGCAAVYFLSKGNYIAKENSKTLYILISVIGGIPILFLNSPGKNVFLNFGVGLWDTYGMLSGLLGDLLSYIRLFALGISSAVLGLVFNQIAIGLSGNIPVVSQLIMILILLFGHTLNLGLSALGSFVHPMRLTFVEFYKNSGFSGGGLKYKPLKK